jgi:hypothetical protein
MARGGVSAVLVRPRARPAMPAVLALARVEAWRLLRHPLFLVGLALNVAAIVAAATQSDAGEAHTYLLSGTVAIGLGIGTFLAANLAAMRDRRGGTGELFAPLPRGEATRTAAQLLALVCTVPLSIGLVVGAHVAFGAGDGLRIIEYVDVGPRTGLIVDAAGAVRQPPLIELVQAPFGVLALGAAGVLLGRLAPTPLLGPLVMAGLFTLETVLVAWGSSSPVQWLLPFSADIIFAPDAWVPCGSSGTDPGCGVITGFDVRGMGWHLGYLVGMTAICCAAALLRGARALVPVGALAAGLAGLMLAVG